MERFYGFGQLIRPDIGLVADGGLNLAEIYTSDQRTALSNIYLEPEVLDIIYTLSRTISREDLRSASGLESPLLQTLDLQSETFYEISDSLDEYISSSSPIGLDPDSVSLSGSDIKLNHAILFNGALHCDGIQYETRTLSPSSLTDGGVRTLTTISTSRASLFNSEKNDATGAFIKAYLSDSIRVRRRSHVNRIEVNPLTFIPRPEVTENPTHKILCWVNDSGDQQASKKMQLLAIKNSPVRIPCRFSSGTIRFTFRNPGLNFYGFKIQPLQTIGGGKDVAFLSVPSQSMDPKRSDFELEIDISKTGYANTFDLYLYLYMNVEEVTSITFSGIGVTDFQDKQDIGLIGFNNLKSLNLSGTRLRYIPIWLKTLGNKIESLDFSGTADNYVDGPFRFFDWRNRSVSPGTAVPLYTAVSYLTVPKLGAILNEDGDDWNDTKFQKYITSQVLSGEDVEDASVVTRVSSATQSSGYDFRAFTALRTLDLGWKFFGINPRFDDVFPNLTTLRWYGAITEIGTRFPLSGGTLTKIGFPGKNRSVEYISYLSGASGSIVDVGTSTDTTAVNTTTGQATYIGEYTMGVFDISGRDNGLSDYYQNITGFIANPNEPEAWTGWLDNTTTIRIQYTKCNIDIQSAEWKKLTSLNSDHLASPGGFRFKVSTTKNSDPIRARLLSKLDAYSGRSTGHLPSLGDITNTSNLTGYTVGGENRDIEIFSYLTNDPDLRYFLPENFAPLRAKGQEHKLESFGLQDGRDGRLPTGRFRYLDFQNLPSLRTISIHRSPNIIGVFPKIAEVLEPTKNSKEISVTLSENCGIYDISTLDISLGNAYIGRDIKSISAWSLNSGGGGCIAPNLYGHPDSKLTTFNMTSLRTYYPGDWQANSNLSSKLIEDADSPSIVGNLTYKKLDPKTSYGDSFSEKDVIEYFETSATIDLRKHILVNDLICVGSSGIRNNAIGTVLSVKEKKIYIRINPGSSITNGSVDSYTFYRQTQQVNQWFKVGFKNLTRFEMHDSRLSGELDIISGFNLITGEDGFRFENNGLTSISTKTFESIFKGSNRSIVLKLHRNNFSAETLKKIVSDLLSIQSKTRFTNVRVHLDNCKLSNKSYGPYTRTEIFPVVDVPQSNETIKLTSFITVRVFREIITTDPETGEPNPPILTQVGTKQVQISGKNVFGDGKYYLEQVNTRVKASEDPLATTWRNSSWDIRLDFSKIDKPNTTIRTISSTYLPSGGKTFNEILALNNIDPAIVV